jgi:polyisoprenoid-binding protein YceI
VPSDRGRRLLWWGGGLALAAVVAVGFAIWYFVFRDTAPPKVDLERATESVEDRGDSAGTLDGTWEIDRSIGLFSDYTSTFAGYRVDEELVGIGAKTAFGRTPNVTGSLTLDGTKVTATSIEVDMTTLVSDEGGRDNQLRTQAIESDQFATSTFELSEPIDLGELPAEGAEIDVEAVGDLTLHGVTKPVTITLQATLQDDVIVVTGQLPIQFADFDIERPTSFRVLSVEDNGIMELQLFFTKQA